MRSYSPSMDKQFWECSVQLTRLLVVMDFNKILVTDAYISNLVRAFWNLLYGGNLLAAIIVHMLNEMKHFSVLEPLA